MLQHAPVFVFDLAIHKGEYVAEGLSSSLAKWVHRESRVSSPHFFIKQVSWMKVLETKVNVMLISQEQPYKK